MLGIYKAIEWIYFNVHPMKKKIKEQGTSYYRKKWSKRGIGDNVKDWDDKGNDWIENYWLSSQHPHRKHLIERFDKYEPKTMLDIGCNCGVNMYMLAKHFPDAHITGTDINLPAIQKGIAYFRKEGMRDRATWYPDSADELFRVPDKSMDVLFTDAVLIYVAPDKIDEIIKDMLRIAKKSIILVEWNIPSIFHKDDEGLGVYHKGLWMRDYHSLFMKHGVEGYRIKTTKITKDVWDDDNWSDVGAIIEVNLT